MTFVKLHILTGIQNSTQIITAAVSVHIFLPKWSETFPDFSEITVQYSEIVSQQFPFQGHQFTVKEH